MRVEPSRAEPSSMAACGSRWQVLDLRRALHAEPGSAEALRLAALRGEHVSAPAPAPAPAPATAPHHHTFDAVMQHHALRTHATVHDSSTPKLSHCAMPRIP